LSAGLSKNVEPSNFTEGAEAGLCPGGARLLETLKSCAGAVAFCCSSSLTASKFRFQFGHTLFKIAGCCLRLLDLQATRPYPRPFLLWHESF